MKRINFLIIGVFIGVLFLIIFVYLSQKWVKREVSSFTEFQIQNSVEMLSESISEIIKICLEEENEMFLNSVIYNIKKRNPQINEISVIDKEGLIIAHTNPNYIFNVFKLPESIFSDIKTKNILIKDEILIYKPVLKNLKDTTAYLFLSISFSNLKEGKKGLEGIFLTSIGSFSAIIILIFIVMLIISIPEREKIKFSTPQYSEFLYQILPLSTDFYIENWDILPYYKKGMVPSIFYKIGKISSEKWFFLYFEGISGGYGWALILPLINAYISKYLFINEEPYTILKGLIEELKKLPLKEGIIEGSIFLFDENDRRIKGASIGDGILYFAEKNKFLPFYNPTLFFDYTTLRGEITSFQENFSKILIFTSGGFTRWKKSKEILEELKNCKDMENYQRILENFILLADKEKSEENKLVVLFNFKKED